MWLCFTSSCWWAESRSPPCQQGSAGLGQLSQSWPFSHSLEHPMKSWLRQEGHYPWPAQGATITWPVLSAKIQQEKHLLFFVRELKVAIGCPPSLTPALEQAADGSRSLPTPARQAQGISQATLHWAPDLEVRANQPLKSHSRCVWFGRYADGAHILPDFEGIAINVSRWIKCCYWKPTGLVQSMGRRGGKGRLRLQIITFSQWWRLFVFLLAISQVSHQLNE